MKYIDGVLEEEVINSLMKQAVKEDEDDKRRLARLTVKCKEIKERMQREDLRDSAKHELNEWYLFYNNERNLIINKYKVRNE